MTQLRVLTLTTLYPNAANPTHGVFVENRLRHFVRRHDVDLRIIAPVPYFPFKSDLLGKYATFAKAPRFETRHGIEVRHPRYLLPPKIGMTFSARSLAFCFEREINRLLEEGWDFDVIDAHYYYPDGVAAAKIAEKLGKPVVVTARGTDINLIPSYPKQHEMILEASAIADASVTVCKALKDEMVRLGATGEKINVLRNGVDLDLFCPLQRDEIRREMNLTGTVLLSVGHLIDRKGHDLVLQAFREIEGATLLIAGTGPEEKVLKALAQEDGIAERVHFLGAVPHEDLPKIYNAADILVLASSREGWPNVLLEAMACGTACVAAPVWGVTEIITRPEAGRVCIGRRVEAIVSAIKAVRATPPARVETRVFAENFSWDETSDGLMTLFTGIVKKKPGPAARSADSWHFERPFHISGTKPQLLVTVDTEEIFDWGKPDFECHVIAPISDIAKFQAVCERRRFKPLYFITWPLLKDQKTCAYFKKLHEDGKADLGLHLHQWVTPPHGAENTPYTSYQGNLSPKLHRQKLSNLIEAFQGAFGFEPVSHRAGRYGVAPFVHQQLSENGIIIDFSPSAGYDHSADGGPDFSGVTNMPWRRSVIDAGTSLICVPVTGARSYTGTRQILAQNKKNTGRFSPLPSLLKKVTAPLRLTPEAFDLKDLQALTNSVVKDGTALLTYSLHSSSLTLGATPYSQTATDIDQLLQKTEAYLSWFTEEIGAPTSLNDIVHTYHVQVSDLDA